MNDLPPWPEKPDASENYVEDMVAYRHEMIAALCARNARLCKVLTDAAEIWRYEGYKATAKFYEKVVEECKEPT